MHSSGDTYLACLVSGGEWDCFLLLTLSVTQSVAFMLQRVSLTFNVDFSGDTKCGLSCFSL